ncbi:MAG TPA: hypothetical protein VM818_20870 [Vicinamibacterales bacterium]|nr:hypothetical protein [Vicinamibacterales bacterium]
MRIHLSLALSILVAGIALSPLSVEAQSAKTTKWDPKAPVPRLPNGKPDFSGNWTRPGTMDITRTFTNGNGTSNKGEPNPLPFTPWGQKQWDNYDPVKNGDYAGSCMPFGWIRSFTPHPMQLLQNNEYIAFLFEQSTMFQLVNTEGLPHRKDWAPTWFGDSRGHWEGDTLVIDIVNFNGYAKLGTIGHPMSEQAHLVMTFSRPEFGKLNFTWTLTDPKTYTRPIKNERVFVYTPEVELMEYACMENNMVALLDGAITPWTQPNDEPSVVPARWEWTSFDLTKSQTYTGVVKEVNWELHKLATAKIDVAGKTYDVMLGFPVRLDFRGIAEEDVAVGKTLTFQAVPSKASATDLRVETFTMGKDTIEAR